MGPEIGRFLGMERSLFYPNVALQAEGLMEGAEAIPEERKVELRALAQWVTAQLALSDSAELVFICTHNSRRSHLAQVWAQVGADLRGLDGVRTFSGGTESTACNLRTVAAMQRAGFEVTVHDQDHGEENPTYAVLPGPSSTPQICFSKTYGDDANPDSGFAAVMTCSSADKGCPIVHGAVARFATPYVDPKVSDGTDQEAATYDARCAQIGGEMLWMMAQVESPVKR
jgi:arsenate reductase (thioredoxin)